MKLKRFLQNIFHTDNPVITAIRDYEAAVDAAEEAAAEGREDDGQAISDALGAYGRSGCLEF